MQQSFDLVVASDINRGIGVRNQLPWRLAGDMKYFRNLTSGTQGAANSVIMGRNTWESIPDKFRPLPNRINIVLTHDPAYPLPDAVLRCGSLDEALAAATARNVSGCFVMGGANVYQQAISHPALRRLYITQVLDTFECDVFFPLYKERFRQLSQSETNEENGIQYRFEVYERNG